MYERGELMFIAADWDKGTCNACSRSLLVNRYTGLCMPCENEQLKDTNKQLQNANTALTTIVTAINVNLAQDNERLTSLQSKVALL